MRESEKSLDFLSYTIDPPVAEWINNISYVLSPDTPPQNQRNKKTLTKPRSIDKGVGTAGERQSKRLLAKALDQTKTGENILKIDFNVMLYYSLIF